MNIVRKDIDQNNIVLTMSIVKADYSEKVEKTLRDYRKKANIPGFRPGMVPAGLIKKMYGKAVMAEEINKIVSDELYNYIKDNNINMLGEPLPNEEVKQIMDFDNDEEFEMSFDLGLAPEFEVELSNKDKVKFYDIAVSDEMIDNQVKTHTGRYGKYVQEEVVEEKDMVKGSLVELAEGGITVADAVLTPAYIKVEEQKAMFVGAKKGDVIVFNPAAAFENEAEVSSLLKLSKEEAATKTGDFQFTIESITRYHESEIDQTLFDKVFGEGAVTTEAEFRAKIADGIKESLQGDSDYKFGLDAREMLLKKFEGLQFPEAFLKRWVLATNENLTPEKLDEDFSKMIEDLKWQLIKDKLAKKGEIKIEHADVLDFAKKIARSQFAQYGMVGMGEDIIENYAQDILKKEDTRKNIVERVAEVKIFDAVKSMVKLDKKEISIDEFNKMFEN